MKCDYCQSETDYTKDFTQISNDILYNIPSWLKVIIIKRITDINITYMCKKCCNTLGYKITIYLEHIAEKILPF